MLPLVARKFIRPCSTLMLLCFALALANSSAQNPHAGNYNGFFYVKNSGLVDLPEMSVGVLIATVDSEGNMRNGVNAITGPTIGTVSASGVGWVA